MAVFRAGLSTWQKVVAILGLVLLFGGFAAVLVSEFGTSVGSAGLANHIAGTAGFLAFGLGLLGYTAIFTADAWRTRPNNAEEWKYELRDGVREFGIVILNIVFYGGTVFIALGALSVADSVLAPALIIIAVCIAVFVLYRRWRKRHPRTYVRARWTGLMLFMAGLGVVACAAGALETTKGMADALAGSRTAVCAFTGFDEHRPTGRYSALATTDLAVELTDADGSIVNITVKEQDREALRPLVDAGGVARVAYYPRTGILVAFESSTDAR